MPFATDYDPDLHVLFSTPMAALMAKLPLNTGTDQFRSEAIEILTSLHEVNTAHFLIASIAHLALKYSCVLHTHNQMVKTGLGYEVEVTKYFVTYI